MRSGEALYRRRRMRRRQAAVKTVKIARSWTVGIGVAAVTLFFATNAITNYFARSPAPEGIEVAVASMVERPGIRFWGDEVPGDLATAVSRWIPHMPRLATSAQRSGERPMVTYLALSGGGSDGAFGAGLLTGWTASGSRPSFEVVTGVSAGALIAPFAFLGSDYDNALRDVWTSYGTGDLAPKRFIGFLGGPSLADTDPLKRIVSKYVDADMLRRIAVEYQRGRLLLVISTNLDAQRPVVWNLGEIASIGTPAALELFRQVLMASAAIPGLFPPAHIPVKAKDGRLYEEMHVDGGVTREVFVAPAQLSFRSFDQFYPVKPLRRIFVIKNGKTEPEYDAVKASTLSIVERSLLTMIKSHQLGDIYRIFRMAKDDGVDFNVAAVPPSFNFRAREAFDKDYLVRLFEVGVAQGRTGGSWLHEPPEFRPFGLSQ
jgi:predicted patatin/cPLA2 family phospholipase